MRQPCRSGFVCLFLLIGGPALRTTDAHAQDERVLIDTQLHEHRAPVVSLDDTSLTVRVDGSTRTWAVADWSAILFDERRWRGISRSRVRLAGKDGRGGLHQLLELSDGQRIFGELVTRDDEDPETLRWAIPAIGEIVVPLERVARVRLVPGSDASSGVPIEDEVVLLNGDLLVGFVEHIGSVLRFEGEHNSVSLPWSLVREVRLANPRVSPAADAPMLWLRDGSTVQIADLDIQEGTARGRLLLAEASAPPVEIDFNDIVGIALAPDRLVPLASLDVLEVLPTEGRLFAPAPTVESPHTAPLGAATIGLHGPMQVVLALPEQADRVGGIARMPRHARVWGDCELVISQRIEGTNDRELVRLHLNGARPEQAFNARLDGATGPGSLVITIESGAFGPVQDEVELARGLILLRRTSEPTR